MITIVTRCDGCGLAPFKCLCQKSHFKQEEAVYLYRAIMACGRPKPPEPIVYTIASSPVAGLPTGAEIRVDDYAGMSSFSTPTGSKDCLPKKLAVAEDGK